MDAIGMADADTLEAAKRSTNVGQCTVLLTGQLMVYCVKSNRKIVCVSAPGHMSSNLEAMCAEA